MTDRIYLDARQVPAQLRGAYSGTKFAVVVGETVTIPAHAGLWDGGSRTTYAACRVSDGAAIPFPGQQAAPWDNARASRVVTLAPGFCVVESRMSRGVDMGLTFHLHPADAAPMLPAPVTLTEMESLVLAYTVGRKSSYMGRNRYQMACDDARSQGRWDRSAPAPVVPTLEAWEAAKASLIARGMLNRAGAVTPAGRNANSRHI
jgi:hypothetical protein